MKKKISNFCNLAVLLGLIFACCASVQAHTINYQSKRVSGMAETLMREHKDKAMYQIPLNDVAAYLPEQHIIKREILKLIAARLVPGKSPIRVLRRFTYYGGHPHSENAKYFFSQLEENIPHTYVILGDRLIFTESASNPALERLKDIFTKHFLISGLQKRVNYSGEFHVHKNKINDEIFLVFDNSSGTYKPPTELLSNVQQLLNNNLNNDADCSDEKIYIITKAYNQKIDIARLFNHESQPFLKKS